MTRSLESISWDARLFADALRWNMAAKDTVSELWQTAATQAQMNLIALRHCRTPGDYVAVAAIALLAAQALDQAEMLAKGEAQAS